MEIKSIIARIANGIGFVDTYAFLRRTITKSQVAILMGHRVSPRSDNWSSSSISPETFEKQIRYFVHNYNVISLEKLVEYIKQVKTLPPKSVVITFDDGYKDNYQYAYPILRKYNLPATIFTAGLIGTGEMFWWDKVKYIFYYTNIKQLDLEGFGNYSIQAEPDKKQASSSIIEKMKLISEKEKKTLIEKLIVRCKVNIPADIGKKMILSWDEIKEMNRNGIFFGPHSVNHPILTKIPLDEAKQEIVYARKVIEEKLDKKNIHFLISGWRL